MTVDVVILSNCTNKEYLAINNTCIGSLINSEKDILFNIIMIESNPDFYSTGFSYQFPNITVVMSNESFNYNKFLNIGLSLTKSEWVVFSNNDVVFHKGWISEIFKVKQQNNKIQSFCPFDRTSPYLSWEKFNTKSYHIGYSVPVQFVGWCFVVERSIFKQTGKFDEQFDLYFQDNDFALTLKKHSVLHAMVPASFVEHIGGFTTNIKDASQTIKYAQDKIKFIDKWNKSYWFLLKEKLTAVFKRR